MSEDRELDQDVMILNGNDQNSEGSDVDGSDDQPQFSSFLANALNGVDHNESYAEFPEVPPINPLLDPPPTMPDSLQNFKPSNWKGLMAAIQNEPIDPIQLGKDIFEETQGSDAKYKCILNTLSGRPFRLDLQTLYNRRAELINRLGGDNDILIELYDFNMGCMAKMDMDRRSFNNVASIVNQNIFYKTINSGKIPEQYKFNPNLVKELLFFTPIDVEEYKSTNSAEILNSVIELSLTDQMEIVRQIALETQNSCVKPEFLGQMSVTAANGKRQFMPEFFTFLKRILYQSFGVPHQKFINLNLTELSSKLPNGEYPYERATAVILIQIAMKTLKCAGLNKTDHSNQSDEDSSKRKNSADKCQHDQKRRKVSE